MPTAQDPPETGITFVNQNQQEHLSKIRATIKQASGEETLPIITAETPHQITDPDNNQLTEEMLQKTFGLNNDQKEGADSLTDPANSNTEGSDFVQSLTDLMGSTTGTTSSAKMLNLTKKRIEMQNKGARVIEKAA